MDPLYTEIVSTPANPSGCPGDAPPRPIHRLRRPTSGNNQLAVPSPDSMAIDTCKLHNAVACAVCAQKAEFEEAVKSGDDAKASEMLRGGADISRTAGPTLRVALKKKMDKLVAELLLSPHLKHDSIQKEGLTFEKVSRCTSIH